MGEISATTPGLLYDPRQWTLPKFYKDLEKNLAKQTNLMKKDAKVKGSNQAPMPKPKDFQNAQPVKDPGPPVIGDFANPRFKNSLWG